MCDESYLHEHRSNCLRPHKSEKPSCSAYVCVSQRSEKVYPCRYCTRFYLSEFSLKKHFSKHVDSLDGKCDLCDKVFSSQRALLTHIRRCVKSEGVHECYVCHKRFAKAYNLDCHVSSVHTNPKQFICEVCGKEFNYLAILKKHALVHTDDRPFSCKKCARPFKSKSHLLRHELRCVTNYRPFPCEQCDLGFITKLALQRHMYRHTKEYTDKLLMCKHCGEKFVTERILIKHLQKEHPSLEPNAGYTCTQCGKLFKDKHNMEAHKLIHLNIRPHQCDMCPKSFRKSSDLTIHKRVHTGEKPHKCDLCHMSFTTNSNLTKHRLSHTGEKPHECKYCNRRFTDKSHLNRHYLTHTGEKPHVCAICERGFATKAQCQQHMLVHTGEKPFQCNSCGKTFRQKAKAQKHRCLWRVLNNQGQTITVSDGTRVHVPGTGDIGDQGVTEVPVNLLKNSPNSFPFQVMNPVHGIDLQAMGGGDVTYQVIESSHVEQVPLQVAQQIEQPSYQVIVNEGFPNVSVQVFDQEIQ